ncbi:MAG: hypothetical protein AAGN66_08675 [Acidobacteriota bacterium]
MRDTWIGRFRRLLDGIDGEILGDPRFAVAMAEHALRLTPTAPGRVSCEATWRALAVYGSALRAAERFSEARAALFTSWATLHSGSRVAVEDEADLCGRLAFFFRDVREAEAAKAMTERKVQLATDSRTRAQALVDQCLILWEAGEADWASLRSLSSEALGTLDPTLDFPFYRTALQTVLVATAEDPAADLAGLPGLLERFEDLEGGADQRGARSANRDWVTGIVLRRLGDIHRSRLSLERARETYLGLGSLIDAATVTMDLAILALESRDPDRVVELAGEMFPLFGAVRYQREAWASLALFCRAALEGRLTAEAARRYKASFSRQASREDR